MMNLRSLPRRFLNRDPILYILLFAILIFSIGIGWGLPHNETWQSDSLAPYHPLVGLSQLFSFGYFHKYPLVHQLILAVLNLPVVIVAFFNSYTLQGFSIYRFIANIRSAETATVLILIDRSVSVLMATLTIYYMYRLVKEIADKQVAIYTALLLCFNVTLNQFAHVAKVDVPYVFWAVVSLYCLVRAVKTEQTKYYSLSALFACCSFGSKDQGYAIFILPFVLYLLVPKDLFADRIRGFFRFYFSRNRLAFAASFIIGTLLVQNVFLNTSGFIKRFHHLTGDAGFRSAAYSLDVMGVTALFVDFNHSLIKYAWGLVVFLLLLSGMVFLFIDNRKRLRDLWNPAVFLIASLSYYLFFIQIVRQVHERFVLLPSVLLTFYAAYALARISTILRGIASWLGVGLTALVCCTSFYLTLFVNLNLLHDVRYSAERWMNRNIKRGSTIEYYSYLHYLPRFPHGVESYRVKQHASDIENRRPDYIVISSLYADRFIGSRQYQAVSGRLSMTRKTWRYRNSAMSRFYSDLFTSRLNYRKAARFDRDLWPFRRLSSVPESIVIFKRNSEP